MEHQPSPRAVLETVAPIPPLAAHANAKRRTTLAVLAAAILSTTIFSLQASAASSLTHRDTFSVVYAFKGGTDGTAPEGDLIRDSAGDLFGTTLGGGDPACIYLVGLVGCGVVFKVDSAGRESVVHVFTGPDGEGPDALILDPAGDIYGETIVGGPGSQGTVFRIAANGTFSIVHSFDGGAGGGDLGGGLFRDTAGNIYGTSEEGNTCCGLIFKLDTSGHETVVHNFTGKDGSGPSDLQLDAAGNLRGITSNGGADRMGNIFELHPSGSVSAVHSFVGGALGGFPASSVLADAAGNLYGVLAGGGLTHHCVGNGGCGVVYKIDPSGKETVLHAFAGGTAGGQPLGSLKPDANGDLFGTTFAYGNDKLCSGAGYVGCGIVYELEPNGTYTVVHLFTGGADGANPFQSLFPDGSGNFYGTTLYGGVTGNGVLFKLTS